MGETSVAVTGWAGQYDHCSQSGRTALWWYGD